jgi:hypothetical protein
MLFLKLSLLLPDGTAVMIATTATSNLNGEFEFAVCIKPGMLYTVVKSNPDGFEDVKDSGGGDLNTITVDVTREENVKSHSVDKQSANKCQPAITPCWRRTLTTFRSLIYFYFIVKELHLQTDSTQHEYSRNTLLVRLVLLMVVKLEDRRRSIASPPTLATSSRVTTAGAY